MSGVRGTIIRCLFGVEAALVIALVATIGFAATSESSTGPLIGDHWHAAYQVQICGQALPPFAFWEGGVHTHDDGIIHSHPVVPSEEGEGATLSAWLSYGGGELTEDSLTLPGGPTLQNGDRCTDNSTGVVQVAVNGERLRDWTDYIPQHGDEVLIIFGPNE